MQSSIIEHHGQLLYDYNMQNVLLSSNDTCVSEFFFLIPPTSSVVKNTKSSVAVKEWKSWKLRPLKMQFGLPHYHTATLQPASSA